MPRPEDQPGRGKHPVLGAAEWSAAPGAGSGKLWAVEVPNGDGTYRVWRCETRDEALALERARHRVGETTARARQLDVSAYRAWYSGKRRRP